ncbi:hypothetical protein L3081_00995 [Colwellia sp. MSW7]|uniref:GH16 domain-containing protein n=1 Tax=Colwellia maritima TaxID=2912588 RepID=A0ABS9WWA5_9GAMM|nr:hypothetical protein [Colwellia maritima]MCI2282239.1 hypothetical protein [Colwellia maritima]
MGTLKGASWNVTQERQSLNFSEFDDYVDFSKTELDIDNDITVAFWINPFAEEGVIMSQDWGYIGNEYGQGPYQWELITT